jgi:hypothetical protein
MLSDILKTKKINNSFITDFKKYILKNKQNIYDKILKQHEKLLKLYNNK